MEPVNIIFSLQYESIIIGRLFGNRGSKITSQVYKGVTIFCDAASSKISLHHQVSCTVEDTTVSNIKFERYYMGAGVTLESYPTDISLYIAKGFTTELHVKGQGIRNSIVGGHHHNGVVANAIKNVDIISRTMMIHDALRWPYTI